MAGIIVGGCCRSASSSTTTAPSAWSMPAVSAASLPKLRDKRRQRTPGCRSQGSSASAVASVLPSSTTITSQRDDSDSSTGSNACSSGPRLSASL